MTPEEQELAALKTALANLSVIYQNLLTTVEDTYLLAMRLSHKPHPTAALMQVSFHALRQAHDAAAFARRFLEEQK